ncbi:unnamed protein product [Victoria cruziana]
MHSRVDGTLVHRLCFASIPFIFCFDYFMLFISIFFPVSSSFIQAAGCSRLEKKKKSLG